MAKIINFEIATGNRLIDERRPTVSLEKLL